MEEGSGVLSSVGSGSRFGSGFLGTESIEEGGLSSVSEKVVFDT